MDPFWNAFHRHDGRQAEAARIQQEDDDYELAIQMATSGDNNLLDDGGDGADDPMARDAADRANWTVCVACNDHGQNFVPECRHPYCGDCLGHVFTQAMNDENLFPPRCCQREIALQDARPMLKGELATQFEAKAVEYRTLDRTYCSNMQCGAFIPPDPTTSGLFGIRYARCLQCSQFTCKGCKNVYHYGPCAVDIGLEQLRATAQGEGWRQCNRCRRMIELAHGCNHMTCVCGHEFCYECGGNWVPKTCRCAQWNEERLEQRAEVLVNREQGMGAGQPVRHRRRVRQVARQLLNVADCAHPLNWMAAVDNPQRRAECELCHRTKNRVYACRDCRIQACYACRRNRLS